MTVSLTLKRRGYNLIDAAASVLREYVLPGSLPSIISEG